MAPVATVSSGVGLEHTTTDVLRSAHPFPGIELLEARLETSAYQTHRHDTYAICLTTSGVQAFDYRGAGHVSVPGQVVILHPDETHDGRPAAGTRGFGYRQVYLAPGRLFDVMEQLHRGPCSLPSAPHPVVESAKLARAVASAFAGPLHPLAVDTLLVELAEGLAEVDRSCARGLREMRLDVAALRQARDFLDAAATRVVRSHELEVVTGLSRYETARQFRSMFGTSPYHYLLMRRVERARHLIDASRPLAEVALSVGFADQAHLSRVFKRAVGLTPLQYRRLTSPLQPP
ncbi:MAG TPA: AraC family transcriptional regulator [Candidatus Dormibacteraeota bacterium]